MSDLKGTELEKRIEAMHKSYQGQWAEPTSKAILVAAEAILSALLEIRDMLERHL